jgi:uncharacterized protein (DUF433 family)
MKKTKGPNRKPGRSMHPRPNGDLLRRITIDPKILLGKPTIRGMRISVEQVLHLLGEGLTPKQILHEFPMLEEEDIRAAVAYAHRLVSTEKVYRLGNAR